MTTGEKILALKCGFLFEKRFHLLEVLGCRAKKRSRRECSVLAIFGAKGLSKKGGTIGLSKKSASYIIFSTYLLEFGFLVSGFFVSPLKIEKEEKCVGVYP